MISKKEKRNFLRFPPDWVVIGVVVMGVVVMGVVVMVLVVMGVVVTGFLHSPQSFGQYIFTTLSKQERF